MISDIIQIQIYDNKMLTGTILFLASAEKQKPKAFVWRNSTIYLLEVILDEIRIKTQQWDRHLSIKFYYT